MARCQIIGFRTVTLALKDWVLLAIERQPSLDRRDLVAVLGH